MTKELIDAIVRTKNSEEFLRECLQSILDEIPIRRIIIVDAGSTDRTVEIASSFERVDVYVKPELNLGQATKFGFSVAQTEWVAVIDSDIILKKGWFYDMKKYMGKADAVESGQITHFRLEKRIDPRNLRHGRIGHILIKREPILDTDLDLRIGEDNVISYNFEKLGLKWEKVENDLVDHYPKIEGTTYRRTGEVFKPEPQVLFKPKSLQIEEGRINRKYNLISKKQVLEILVLVPIYEAYRAFKRNFWFTLAYFRIIK